MSLYSICMLLWGACSEEGKSKSDAATAEPVVDAAVIDAVPVPDAKSDAGLEEVNLIAISGGTFEMGSDNEAAYETPAHSVTVPSFQIMKAEVSVSQFRSCVEAGVCLAPTIDDAHCNLGSTREATHPMNCVGWGAADNFCRWANLRLPTEAEWEFAARGGSTNTYPWGEDLPTCNRATMADGSGSGCGNDQTAPSCSHPLGNTSTGLCDMAGNVWEWVEDDFHFTYVGAPTDGSAWIDSPRSLSQSYRGGSFAGQAANMVMTSRNGFDPFAASHISIGFRCVK